MGTITERWLNMRCSTAEKEVKAYCKSVSAEPKNTEKVSQWEMPLAAVTGALALSRVFQNLGPYLDTCNCYGISGINDSAGVLSMCSLVASSAYYIFVANNREETRIGHEVFKKFTATVKEDLKDDVVNAAIKAFSQMGRERKYFNIGSPANGSKVSQTKLQKLQCSVLTGYNSRTAEAVLANLTLIRLYRDLKTKTITKEELVQRLAKESDVLGVFDDRDSIHHFASELREFATQK